MLKILTHTANISFPAGTPAGIRNVPTQLDSEYSKATGFAAYNNSDNAMPNFQLGLRDDTTVYATLTNAKYFQAGIECPKNQRLTPTSIPCTGRTLNLVVNLLKPLETDLNVDVVFQLEGASNAR